MYGLNTDEYPHGRLDPWLYCDLRVATSQRRRTIQDKTAFTA